ncbi:branched-chain-amino-acid aminotransferas-like protein [Halenospora varia]|nr:branched-chain-amino-acid aminotransferas-like protein [Halenospora varia]
MNGHAVETVDHLTSTRIKDREQKAVTSPSMHDLDASELIVTLTQNLRPVPELNSKEVWGVKACTDHMVSVTWTDDYGWHAPKIVPYGPLEIMPTASCLHYATQCFEGMKVYRGFDGKLRLFRPDRNCARLVSSASRVALPTFNPLELERLLKALMKLDGPRWLPKSQPGNFLYLRPAMIGNGEQLGVVSPSEVLLFIIAVPWPDLSTGWNPANTPKTPGLRLLASKNDTRAWPGGFGYAKVGANYGPAFVAQMEGRKQGYDQILWLFGPDFQVTEAGASNFFVVWRTPEGKLQLITAPLEGKIILDGVTRRSVLDLASERFTPSSSYLSSDIKSLEIAERTYTMDEVVSAQKEGRLIEAFVSGTAYFITPVSAISFRDEDLEIPMAKGETGVYAGVLKQWLLDIKYGKVEHEWGVVVEEE